MTEPQRQNMSEVFFEHGVTPQQLAQNGVNLKEFLNHTFHLPRYPVIDVCYEYQSYCSDFIHLAGMPSLLPTCEAMISPTARLFPNQSQVVLTLHLNLSATNELYAIHFNTTPNLHIQTTKDTSGV
jgi:hypothetical protein